MRARSASSIAGPCTSGFDRFLIKPAPLLLLQLVLCYSFASEVAMAFLLAGVVALAHRRIEPLSAGLKWTLGLRSMWSFAASEICGSLTDFVTIFRSHWL